MTAAGGEMQLALELPEAGDVELPRQVDPMRARLISAPFDSPDYLFETRWNGIRAVAAVQHGEVTLRNRRVGDISDRFPELGTLALAASEQPLLLDGEILVVDERGRPDFDALQRRLRLVDRSLILAEAKRQPACYLASDLLFRGQRWLLADQLERRKRLLADVLHPSDTIYLAEAFDAEGQALFQAAVESDLEGVVAKPRSSLYAPGAYGQWLAVGRGREEFVVGGYSMRIAGSERSVELLIGAYDVDGRLVFVQAVPPPADETVRNELFPVLNALQVEQPQFAETPPFIACWVRPEVVLTVSFSQRPGRPEPRSPFVERVRLDVAPDECLLPVDLEVPGSSAKPDRPQLTMLTTLPLPLAASGGDTRTRPALRVVGDGM